jgi:hypothetical protein
VRIDGRQCDLSVLNTELAAGERDNRKRKWSPSQSSHVPPSPSDYPYFDEFPQKTPAIRSYLINIRYILIECLNCPVSIPTRLNRNLVFLFTCSRNLIHKLSLSKITSIDDLIDAKVCKTFTRKWITYGCKKTKFQS